MKILEHIDLLPYNTFHISCEARYFVVIESVQDFLELMESDIYQHNKKLILGGGSNILLTDSTYDGLVIKNDIQYINIIEETDTSVTVSVGAGQNRDRLVQWAIGQGYTGCENLISIPGTVGAAPMQNIGAYGVEVKDIIKNVSGVDMPSRAEIMLASYECEFGYRDSVFKQALKNKFFITQVTFELGKYDPKTYFPTIQYGAIQDKLASMAGDLAGDTADLPLTPQLIADAIADIRESKLPNRKEIGTAGSFFKNPLVSKEKYKQLQSIEPSIKGYPVPAPAHPHPKRSEECHKDSNTSHLTSSDSSFIKLNAGQLIDLAGLKGLQQGNVGTYHKHALVLINHGDGTGADIVALADRIAKIVFETFGVEIVPEVNYVY